MNNANWSDPRMLAAAANMAHRIRAGDPCPAVDADGMNDNERALAHYLGRTMVKLSQLVQKDLIDEGICTKCGGDDVECLNECTLHKCVDCNHVLSPD
jgi:hypothetical protein